VTCWFEFPTLVALVSVYTVRDIFPARFVAFMELFAERYTYHERTSRKKSGRE
jgi:hypothetical protein